MQRFTGSSTTEPPRGHPVFPATALNHDLALQQYTNSAFALNTSSIFSHDTAINPFGFSSLLAPNQFLHIPVAPRNNAAGGNAVPLPCLASGPVPLPAGYDARSPGFNPNLSLVNAAPFNVISSSIRPRFSSSVSTSLSSSLNSTPRETPLQSPNLSPVASPKSSPTQKQRASSSTKVESGKITCKVRRRTRVACFACHRAKSGCDASRPCRRCLRLNRAHQCVDRPHRRIGRPRRSAVKCPQLDDESIPRKRSKPARPAADVAADESHKQKIDTMCDMAVLSLAALAARSTS